MWCSMLLFRVMKCRESDTSLMEKVSCIYPPRVPNYVKHVSLFNALLNNVNVPFNYVQGTRGGYIHEVSACKGT